MAEEPDEKREPNLELPQLRLPGFRRKKVRRSERVAEETPVEDRVPGARDPGPHPVPDPRLHRQARLRRKSRTWRRTFSGARTTPSLPGPLAAAVSGIVVGAAGTGTTYGGMRGCEALNRVPSCGAPGLGYLLAIALGMVALGALLLRACHAPEPVGTSFLGVGTVVVVVLVGLTGVIFSPWMFLAIPLLTAAAYVGAHWLATRHVEPVGPPPGPDVR